MSTAEPTIFPIDGDSTGFVGAIDRARAALAAMIAPARQARASLDGLENQANQTARAVDNVDDKLDKFAETSSTASKAGGILGGTLGGLVSNLGDLDELLNSNLSTKQKFALQSLAVAAALGGVATATLDVITNLNDYRSIVDDLEERELITPEHKRQLETAHAATVALAGAWKGFKVTLADTTGFITERVSMSLIGLQGVVAAVMATIKAQASGVDPFEAIEIGMQAREAVWRAAEQELQAAGAIRDRTEREQALLAQLGLDDASFEAVEATKETRTATAAIRERTAAVRELRSEVGELTQEELDRAFGVVPDAGPVQGASSVQTMGGSEWTQRFNAAQDELVKQPEKVKVAWQDALGAVANIAEQMFSAINGFAENYVRDDSERSKRAARRAFGIAKASALAQAALAIPLAIINQLKTEGALGIAGAIVAGVMGATNLALIAAQPPPQFHRGGLVGDEMFANVRRNEVVLSPRGAASMGLDTPQAVDRANAGQIDAGGSVYVVIGDEVVGAVRRLAQGARPGIGHRQR